MRKHITLFLDEDLYYQYWEVSVASKLTNRPWKINEIVEYVLPDALDKFLEENEAKLPTILSENI